MLCGRDIGKWYVIAIIGRPDGSKLFLCRCKCGSIRRKTRADLIDRKHVACNLCCQADAKRCIFYSWEDYEESQDE